MEKEEYISGEITTVEDLIDALENIKKEFEDEEKGLCLIWTRDCFRFSFIIEVNGENVIIHPKKCYGGPGLLDISKCILEGIHRNEDEDEDSLIDKGPFIV